MPLRRAMESTSARRSRGHHPLYLRSAGSRGDPVRRSGVRTRQAGLYHPAIKIPRTAIRCLTQTGYGFGSRRLRADGPSLTPVAGLGCWVPASSPPAQQAGTHGRLHGRFASPSHSGPTCASLARLRAAFRSRSIRSPQASQVKVRSARMSVTLTHPQAEHVLDEEYGQMTNANVHPYHACSTVAGREMPITSTVKENKPPVRGPTDGGGEDAGGSLFDPSSELAGGLVGLERADPWKLNVLAIGPHSDGAGGEPGGISPPSTPAGPIQRLGPGGGGHHEPAHLHRPVPVIAATGAREWVQ